jgi:hypothetical protein
MKKQEFLNLNEDEKFKFLNEEAAKGKNLVQITSELGITKEELGNKMGFYFVGNKFMRKPMKGYQTTKRSGNESTDK